MLKRTVFLSLISIMTIGSVYAADSAIYTDDLGRLHFMGRGDQTYVRPIKLDDEEATPAQKGDLDEVINSNSQEESVKPVHTNKSKGSFTSTKGAMDPSNPYIYGGTNIEPKEKGVNDSKTIYTDGLGRKHFFGKQGQTD